MSIEKTNKNKGDGASLTAPNEDDQAVEKNGESLENSETKPEGTDKKTEDATQNSDKEHEDNKKSEEKKDKDSGKRKKSSQPEKSSKKPREEKSVKICIVLEKFPDELLTTDQLKLIQESITDRILELGEESATKPKFLSSTHCEGWLSVMCADKKTSDWLLEVTGSLKPWEEASLRALEDNDMPHPETFVAFLPESQDYSDDKILKLLEAQNDTFNVSSWKVLKRDVVDSEVEVTFSIDRKYTENLRKAGNRVSYKFGHVKLFPKDKKKAADKAGDSKSKPGSAEWRKMRPKPPKGRKPPPGRSDWRNSPRGGFKGSRSDWRSNQRSRGSSRGSRASDFRLSSSQQRPWAWSEGQGGSWGVSGSWNPWN